MPIQQNFLGLTKKINFKEYKDGEVGWKEGNDWKTIWKTRVYH